MDATQTKEGGVKVVLKAINNGEHPNEVAILKLFSSVELRDDAKNHCVPVYDILADTVKPSFSSVVMTSMRPFDNPDFVAIGEVLDFVEQTLEVGV